MQNTSINFIVSKINSSISHFHRKEEEEKEEKNSNTCIIQENINIVFILSEWYA